MYMKNLKMVCFDMDGTIADLYGVNGWLDMLCHFDPTPYEIANPMWDMRELADILYELQAHGIEIRIITWLSKDSNTEYDEMVRTAKREWLETYGLPIDHFHGVQYGATKADSVRKYLGKNETAVLFDDNAKVRKGWHLGESYDPTTCDICEVLRNLLK